MLVLALIVAGAAFAAGRKPGDFQAPAPMTAEELAEAKARSKTRLNGFDEKQSDEPKKTPWMMISLIGIVFLAATPFAVRAFRNTSNEIAGSSEAVGANRDD